jgi:hypothetical protein
MRSRIPKTNVTRELEMTDTSMPSRGNIFLSKDFLEKCLFITAIPIWLGVAVYFSWININQFYLIFLAIYTCMMALLFAFRYVKRTPVVGQVGFLIFMGIPIVALMIYGLIFVSTPSDVTSPRLIPLSQGGQYVV